MSFYETITNLCLEKNTSVTAVCKALHLSTSTPTAWRNGTLPGADILLRLSEHFGVSTDYLLTGDASFLPRSEYESELLTLFSELTSFEKQRWLGRLEQYLEDRRNEK